MQPRGEATRKGGCRMGWAWQGYGSKSHIAEFFFKKWDLHDDRVRHQREAAQLKTSFASLDDGLNIKGNIAKTI